MQLCFQAGEKVSKLTAVSHRAGRLQLYRTPDRGLRLLLEAHAGSGPCYGTARSGSSDTLSGCCGCHSQPPQKWLLPALLRGDAEILQFVQAGHVWTMCSTSSWLLGPSGTLQMVIDTMPMNHTTASFFHHFEPLYSVIGDMPRPPASLLTHVAGVRHEDTLSKMKADGEKQEGPDLHVELNMHEVVHLSPYSLPNESGIPEPLLITSDSESDIFCDSVDSVEQLSSMTIQASKSLSVYNGQEVCPGEGHHQLSHLEGRQAGAGQGGEGAEYRRGQRPPRGSREPGREACYRPAPTGEPRQAPQGGAGGSGQRGGDGSEGRAERLHDAYLQQQVILALRRLREDMGSVMERLEVVERLAASHVPGSEWRTCLQCAASQQRFKVDRHHP
ncbi:acyl-CoA-binding domain-containing protein 4 isoform X3 [Nothobranchius furzeri]|uniref:acyl-CoA-binding domain-containing protein 4 isoform X3 n=1 Tax=Nothobranchius furzeri TaxID=105023 RepID=UPI00390471CF